MAIILSIETSTKVCSVALHRAGELLAMREGFEANSHSETLVDFIKEVLRESELSEKDLNTIAVSKGPGSYTGLRIGVSTAKGLAYALDLPIVAVETMESLAMHGKEKAGIEDGLIIPMIDARRMEVYCGVYNQDLETINKVSAEIIDEQSFEKQLQEGNVYFFGNGADKCKGTITHPNAVFIEDVYTSAKQVGTLAYEKFKREEFEDLAYFEPYYLKEFMTKPSKKKLL